MRAASAAVPLSAVAGLSASERRLALSLLTFGGGKVGEHGDETRNAASGVFDRRDDTTRGDRFLRTSGGHSIARTTDGQHAPSPQARQPTPSACLPPAARATADQANRAAQSRAGGTLQRWRIRYSCRDPQSRPLTGFARRLRRDCGVPRVAPANGGVESARPAAPRAAPTHSRQQRARHHRDRGFNWRRRCPCQGCPLARRDLPVTRCGLSQ